MPPPHQSGEHPLVLQLLSEIHANQLESARQSAAVQQQVIGLDRRVTSLEATVTQTVQESVRSAIREERDTDRIERSRRSTRADRDDTPSAGSTTATRSLIGGVARLSGTVRLLLGIAIVVGGIIGTAFATYSATRHPDPVAAQPQKGN